MNTQRKFDDSILLDIDRHLHNSLLYFIQFGNFIPQNYAGWKFTIVGKSIDDAVFLCEKLATFLLNIDVPFKVGTHRLVNCGDGEQQFKLMTIYIMKDTNAELLQEDINHFLRDYKGGEDIKLKWSTQINEYLYKRADIDENGQYIYADPDHQ